MEQTVEKSSVKNTFDNGQFGQMDFKEVISRSLISNFQQQGAFSGEIKLRSSEFLSKILASCVKGQEFTCDDTQHEQTDQQFAKIAKESQAVPETGTNASHYLDKETIEMLRSVLSRMELKKDEAGMWTPCVETKPSPDRNPSKIDLNPSKTFFHLPHNGSRCIHSNVKSAVVKVAQKPSSQATLTSKSKEKDRDRSDGSLPFKSKQLDFLEALKEKLKQKDLENRQIVQLLLIAQQELKDAKKMSKAKEVEARIIVQKLKCEELKNAELAKKLNNACEDMREKLCEAKDNNESFVKQLKALLEKYERLKKRANAIKQQLLEERAKKQSAQKSVKKVQQMAEELLSSQDFLEQQRDAAVKELSDCRRKLQTMEEEHKKHVSIVQRVKGEASAIRSEYLNLREELSKTQEENKKLKDEVQSKDLEKDKAVGDFQECKNVVKKLYAELDESKLQKESIYQELEAMKKEFNLIHNKHKVENLHLQEEKKACMKQFEGVRMEREALKEVVSKLKKDKQLLKEELERLQKEKARAETASYREGQRMREAVRLLERERTLLLDEMKDLRKDYFNLSDRITQRIGQLDQADAPMCITDISSIFHQNQASNVDNTVVSVASSVDMIQHIRRKLEEEENNLQK
ncbi:coiled-coil domain-containing protein 110 [Astyanax mexicanus]|uniref:coiled-coil domain-containing protein 110 n=1 Tax=Astyanax mexicanus TaxID=7994 RepID=UPI0020CAB89E|nr:coiled-coil domain-containing protein 110 [Astyanax mexicanus]